MTTLYNCHTEGHGYRITKFDSLGNVEASYSCTEETCECPAGHRHTCRHREMLKIFIRQKAVDTFQFYDYDRGGWVMNEPINVPEAEEAYGTSGELPPLYSTPGDESQPTQYHHPSITPVTVSDEPAVIITKPEPAPTPFKRRI